MKRKYKNITVPYFYFDDKNNNSYFIYQDKEYTKLNELFKDFIDDELTYHIEVKDKQKEVHNLEDVVELLINNYKTFKIPRKYYEEIALQKHFTPVNSVSKDLTYLVVADLNSNSSKMQKAKKYEINIITVEEFMAL